MGNMITIDTFTAITLDDIYAAGVQVNKHADPTAAAAQGIDIDTARSVAAEDESLLWIAAEGIVKLFATVDAVLLADAICGIGRDGDDAAISIEGVTYSVSNPTGAPSIDGWADSALVALFDSRDADDREVLVNEVMWAAEAMFAK